jgi:hypothetical protein
MDLRYSLFPRWRTLAIVLVATVCVAASAVAPVQADQSAAEKLKALDTSLNLIPDDAAFYSATLHNREKIEAIAASRAWAKLLDMPVVKMLHQMYDERSSVPGTKAAKLSEALENPEVQDLLALLGDMFSEDVFVYGDADMVESVKLMQEIAATMRYGPAVLKISGKMNGLDENKAQGMLLIAALAENVDRLKAPGMVFGFKITDTNRAILHLGKLEGLLGVALSTQGPEAAKAIARKKINGGEYLVLTLAGKMVPWDKIPLEELKSLELEEGSVEKIIEKLKKEDVVVALGVRGNYLLVSIGSSTEPLTRLGSGSGLASRPEMVPLARFADKRIVSIAYVGQDMMKVLNGGQQQVDDAIEFLGHILPSLKLTDDQKAQIRKDADELAKTVKERMPVVGAMSGVDFLSEQGIESYSFDWTTRPGLDGTKTLGLLRHVGGSPILAVVGRGKCSVADYDLMVKWLKKGYGYFREYGVPNMQESERKEFERFADLYEPVLARVDSANRDKLLPALDGQIGLVVDAKLRSKQFLNTLPATEHKMPMAEPAILLGLRDADLMREALVEYWSIIQEAFDAAGKLDDKLAEVTLPEPQTITTDLGELFAFVPPDECPVDKQITPNVGLGRDVCVFSMSQAHSKRLLKKTPLAVGGVLGSVKRPLAVAAVFNWAELLRAGRPWIDLAVEKIIEERLGSEAPQEQADGIRKQVGTAIELLSVLRSVTSEAYFEDGAMVVHTLTEIQDLD